MNIFEPTQIASNFRQTVKAEITRNKFDIRIIGFLVSDDPASEVYANYTKEACRDVGIQFHLNKITHEHIAQQMENANRDKEVHGIFVYYPIYGDKRDDQIKDRISHTKDVEGLSSYWMDKLYANQRFDDPEKTKKCVLPCTPLAIIKLLEQTSVYDPQGLPFDLQTIAVFNRSEVVGRPLAYMLANDGARVYSFDVNGGLVVHHRNKDEAEISREQALRESDIVITGVPSKSPYRNITKDYKAA